MESTAVQGRNREKKERMFSNAKQEKKMGHVGVRGACGAAVRSHGICRGRRDRVCAEDVRHFWALVPPIVAIALALITKEVYSSLFIGILVGAVFYSNFSFEGTVTQIFQGGIISVLSDSYNVGILVFLVILGVMVCLMNNAGGSAAFGRWAGEHIKSRVGAQLATILLGVLIFIDDYFNCLTVGSVMRPVTDKQQVSRAKLAYLIDATAAPVCIIAPISSWAAAVSGFVEGEDGLSLFVRAIPYNFYALLTIVMMVGMVLMKVEFGSMAVHEKNAKNGDLYTTPGRPYALSLIHI